MIKMETKTAYMIIIGIIIIGFVIGAYFYAQMPPMTASHWNAARDVDGYLPKIFILILMPGISIILLLLFISIPRIDPLKHNIKKFRKYFDEFIIVIMLFLLYLQILTIVWGLGYRFHLVQFLSPSFAVLFYYAGVLTENARQNWFIGIRTPWTLSSKVVWDRTNKLGGKLFKICGIIALLGIVFPHYIIAFIIVPIIVSVVYAFVYSYYEYKKKK